MILQLSKISKTLPLQHFLKKLSSQTEDIQEILFCIKKNQQILVHTMA